MKKEAIQEYATRVSQASKSDLIVILYEMILTELKEGKDAFQENDLLSYEKNLKQAQKYLVELMGSLNYTYELSLELLSLYIFVNERIITALMKKEPTYIDSAESIMDKLLVGFEGVSKADNSGPAMKNTQQVYAGLTYDKGKLNETYLDPNDNNRGFIA